MSATSDSTSGATRRKFLYLTTTSVLAIGVAAALWPAIDQMNPDASAEPEQREIDLLAIPTGQAKTVIWRQKPIFIRHRTPGEVQMARMTPLGDLRDTDARLMGAANALPATDENRTKPGKESWLVAIGYCASEGCVLRGQNPEEQKGDYGGWLCPCCYSHYDTSGRVRKGPAPSNLVVPPYRFTSNNRITIGCIPEVYSAACSS